MDKKLSVEEIIRNFEAEKAKNLDTVPETKKEETNEGKTAIIQRYTKNTFSTKYQVTIGTEFSLKELRWDLSTILKVHFWDIAGQERTGAVTRQFYKSSHGIILVCDASRSKTYSGLVKWIGNLKQYVLQFDGTPVPIFLLINKCDLPSPSVNVKSLNSLCLDYELDAWYMTSAKIDVNIGEAMFHVIKRALKVKRDADRYASLYTITEENILLHDERTHLPSGRHSRSKRCCDFK
ncbi:ras-related protein Rab-32-like isoform X2 [Lycorma delicatula]|uniref:ras-related protein Rab-32-like isoform X2 n=1 Tax=Lycorma delicatula TaxID=130591 RepID=UPI003F513606